MPTLESSQVSCGVDQFSEFYDYDQYDGPGRHLSPERCLKDLVFEIKAEQRRYAKWPCAIIVWSDVRNGPGDRFGQWLEEQFPSSKPIKQAARNPNSGNNIVAYVWTLPKQLLRRHPLWKEVNVETYDDERYPERNEWAEEGWA